MRLIAAALVWLLAGVLGAQASERPSIVLIVADDLGWNDVSYHGSEIPTPHIDSLAAEGLELDSFYVESICSPTRAGLLTGRWPVRSGITYVVMPWEAGGLPAEEQTLAEALALEGYRNRALLGKWHLGHAELGLHPLSQGFTEFYGHYNGAIDYFTHEAIGEVDWHHNFQSVDEEGYATHLIADAAIDRIETWAPAHRAGEPFFLFVSFNAPHVPLQAPDYCLDRFPELSPPRDVYAAMVSCLDDSIGEILDALDTAGIADDTVVWFLSDNGALARPASWDWGGDNSPLRGGKAEPYEGGIRVPAAVRWRAGGLEGGRRVTARIGYIDVLPTLRAIVGATVPPALPLDGHDVLPVLQDSGPSVSRDWYAREELLDGDERMSVISGDWKLVSQTPPGSTSLAVELFRIVDDPLETTDVASLNAPIVSSLSAALDDYRDMISPDSIVPSATSPAGWEVPVRWQTLPEPTSALSSFAAVVVLGMLRSFRRIACGRLGARR